MGELGLKQVDYQPSADGGYEMVEGHPVGLHGLYSPYIEYEALRERFKEANDTYEVSRGPSGREYEIIVFNPEQLSKVRILKPSTSFSSLYKNPGNALETALSATINPGAAYIYIASFGNYPTGHMTGADLAYVARTGRYTRGDGTAEHPYRPLGSVEDMAETLAAHDLNLSPTYLTADVEAGRLALGLMNAFERNSISGAYLNGLDGISPHANYVPAKLTEDLLGRIRRRRIKDGQPGEVTPVNIKEVKREMSAIYHGLGRVAHLAPLPVLLFPRDVADKLAMTVGFARPGHSDLAQLDGHAVFQDMRAALERQDATLTLQFNEKSAIHDASDTGDCVRFGKMVMDSLPADMRTDNRRVRLLIGEGTLDQNTDAPHDRARVEGFVFPDIAQRMAALAGGLALDAQILELQPLRESA